MKSQKNLLLKHLQTYFNSHLRQVRGASPHTVRAYGNSLRLFFLFLAKCKKSQIQVLRLEDFQAEQVLAFLMHVESERGNGAATRNCRLAAIRSFATHLIRHDVVSRAEQYQKIIAIPSKRSLRRSVIYLEPEEVQQIVNRAKEIASKGDAATALQQIVYAFQSDVKSDLSFTLSLVAAEKLDNPVFQFQS